MIKAVVYVDDLICPQYEINVGIWQNSAHNKFYGQVEIIDAKYGYTQNMEMVSYLCSCRKDIIVLTNSLEVFNAGDIKVLINKKNLLKDYYIMKNDRIINICDLTDKEIKCSHNLAKLYTNDGFEYFEEKFYE